MFSRLTTFLYGKNKTKPKYNRPSTVTTTTQPSNDTTNKLIEENVNISKSTNKDRKKILCRVIFLDNTEQIFKLDKESIAEELLDQVIRMLDLIERDYFSLQYEYGDQMLWLDMNKTIRSQIKKNFTFHFKVKFFPPDPDELAEELTRYHFYLQARKDIRERKISPPNHICVELAALSLQSELGDYEDLQNDSNYIKNFKFIPKQTDEFEKRVATRHHELISMTPGECEMNYLRIIKNVHGYGSHKFSVTNILGLQHELCLGSKGIIISRNNIDLENYFWEQMILIAFKRKLIKLKIQNRNNKKKRKFLLIVDNTFIAKDIWKLCIEYHSFFRLIKSVKKEKKPGFSLTPHSSYIYQGRTLYESLKVTRGSLRRKSFKRNSQNSSINDRRTSGYLRLGSRVLSKGFNGEYYHGHIVALSDKIYVKNDNGNTAAFSRDVEDAIIFDADPDPSDVVVGTRVIARWPGIDSFLPGTVEKIEGHSNFRRYWIFFDDEDHHWNNIDQIRLLKPPLYFGPGSSYIKSFKDKSHTSAKTIQPDICHSYGNGGGATASTPVFSIRKKQKDTLDTSYSSIEIENNTHPCSNYVNEEKERHIETMVRQAQSLCQQQPTQILEDEGITSSSRIDIGTQETIL